MDKETLSNYGWIVICILVLAIMIALATPFGQFVANGVQVTVDGLTEVLNKSKSIAGLDSDGDDDIENNAPITPLDHTVTFLVNGEVYEVLSVKDGNSVNAPATNPNQEGSFFYGWTIGENTEENLIKFPYTPTDNIELNCFFKTVHTEIELSANEWIAYIGASYSLKDLKKLNDEWAILGCYYPYGVPAPILIGTTTTACRTSGYYDNDPYYSTASLWTNGTVEYKGTIYYYSAYFGNTSGNRMSSSNSYDTQISSDQQAAALATLKYYFND
jgi:hypothetical protein